MPSSAISIRPEGVEPEPGAGEPVFAAPWEAQVFALVVALHERGLFAWPEWTETLGRAIRSPPGLSDPVGCRSPYLPWIVALEAILVAKSVTSPGMLRILRDLWDDVARGTPHGQPLRLDPGRQPAAR